MTFVKLQATCRDWPITTPGKPGIAPPRSSTSGDDSSTVYQTSGIEVVMCGSPARSGAPVTDRSPDTAQLFEPTGSAEKPTAWRTSAICAETASASPDHG